MKRTIQILIGALSFPALALTASAQVAGEPATAETAPSIRSQAHEQAAQPAANPSDLIGTAKIGDIIGMEVMNHQDENLGSVQELALDVESGRILLAIVSTGGFLGVGASERAVPPGALVHDAERKVLRLDAGKEDLESAPPFDTSKWTESFSVERLSPVYKHFGQESSFGFVDETGVGNRSLTIPALRLDRVQRASQILGMKVANLQDDAVGDVEEILVDLRTGRLIALVVASGDFLGVGGELSAIPAAAFRFSADRETLQFDISKADLAAAPHFKADQWPDFTQADTVGAFFAAHAIEPYYLSASDQIPRATTGEEPSPPTQGASQPDMDTTAAIRKEIRALKDVSLNARNVSVVTNEGHTTLSGRVDTAEEKRIIGEIADRNNGSAAVDNRLEIKLASTAP